MPDLVTDSHWHLICHIRCGQKLDSPSSSTVTWSLSWPSRPGLPNPLSPYTSTYIPFFLSSSTSKICLKLHISRLSSFSVICKTYLGDTTMSKFCQFIFWNSQIRVWHWILHKHEASIIRWGKFYASLMLERFLFWHYQEDAYLPAIFKLARRGYTNEVLSKLSILFY